MVTEAKLQYVSALQQDHHPNIARLMREAGYQVTQDEFGAITQLEWDNQEQDFLILNIVSAYINTIDFENSTHEELKQVVENITVALRGYVYSQEQDVSNGYAYLSSRDIPVSKAQQGTVPFEHILKVVQGLEYWSYLDKLGTAKEKKEFFTTLVIAGFWHDWGKTIIAQGDVHQYHAVISSLLLQEWIETIPKQERTFDAEALLDSVLLHHAFQLIDMGKLTHLELRQIVPESTSYAVLALLAAADANSVEQYLHFAFGGVVDAVQAAEIQEDESAFNLLWSQLAIWIAKLYDVFLNLKEQNLLSEDNLKYIQQKSSQLVSLLSRKTAEADLLQTAEMFAVPAV